MDQIFLAKICAIKKTVRFSLILIISKFLNSNEWYFEKHSRTCREKSSNIGVLSLFDFIIFILESKFSIYLKF